ncbi:MAG: hypothetical protein CMI60_02830 [Parvibaculum sp.]|nr:hypothetical protein [Parvibaculum sp.]
MLDNYINILWLASPLKKKAFKKAKNFLFGDNSAKEDGKKKLAAHEKALDQMSKDLKNIDTSNPYENAKNAMAGLDNKMAGLDNVYDKAENVYEGKMKNAFEGQKNAYDGMKNQMEGMENAFEDLTVNTQQAEFEAQQNQQMQANIMSQMSGAAGGSGIAALAQSMANQGALQAQKASASIGAQEADNQKKAAEAEQDINMKTADEASKIAMTQAGESARLDDQKRSADMDIQNKILGADEALQNQKLGEASKLQMAEAQEASNLQMAEAQGEMDVQKLKGEGDMWSKEQEIGKAKTAMDVKMSQAAAAAAEAGQPKDRGLLGNLFSDERLKENIVKLGTSHNHIPIYKFNYIGDKTTYVGTMAQDLLEMGRDDAVGTKDGYYTVNYNSIDVDMIKLPSPLKQISDQAAQEKGQQDKGMMEAGMDILSEAQKRKNWEDLQKDVKALDPLPMQVRKEKDRWLRQNQRDMLGPKGIIEAPGIEGIANSSIYMKALTHECKRAQDEMYEAIQKKDNGKQMEINQRVATLKRIGDRFREECQEFCEDHFTPGSKLSRGVSQQKLSFATQLYCDNPEADIVFAEEEDALKGTTDYYGKTVVAGSAYALCYDFEGDACMINVLEGNKEMWWSNMEKAMEYLGFLTEITKDAQEAAKNKETVNVKPILGRINYKIDGLFGNNDGTATQLQNQLVTQFCWDEHILKDGSSFRRHLFEHPNIQNLNYGGFDWDKMEFKQDLGPGDKMYWTDNLDKIDQLNLVKAITDIDSEYFDIDLLRTLVKEYYSYKIENAWWKSMGYDEGKLTVMRLKQQELIKVRFAKDQAKAAEEGATEFTFDGRVYPTGLDKAAQKEQEEKFNKGNK